MQGCSETSRGNRSVISLLVRIYRRYEEERGKRRMRWEFGLDGFCSSYDYVEAEVGDASGVR